MNQKAAPEFYPTEKVHLQPRPAWLAYLDLVFTVGKEIEYLQYLPIASALLIGGLTLTSFTLNQAGRNMQRCVSTVFWAGLTAGVTAVVKINGRQFCSRPRLCRLL
ncbi:Phosphoinositide phosphatase SAC8 [Vitis vinifera]|uniref:Phosphoinositide phosphatase SAC8 n=1 Tax=Vitis vinifera TaxID=29760 RepID=A0A438HKK9_VITVI|nr:Phosphoinositide phosphatase SAC8 [Vitis vinifera]